MPTNFNSTEHCDMCCAEIEVHEVCSIQTCPDCGWVGQVVACHSCHNWEFYEGEQCCDCKNGSNFVMVDYERGDRELEEYKRNEKMKRKRDKD